MIMIDAPEDWVVSLGTVVWGCVRGHPWWPARISMNVNGTWYNTSTRKVWVSFFNDDSCAWLSPKEIRPFDSYFRSAALKRNAARRRFRKQEPSIMSAIQLAEQYVENEYNSGKVKQPWNLDDPDSVAIKPALLGKRVAAATQNGRMEPMIVEKKKSRGRPRKYQPEDKDKKASNSIPALVVNFGNDATSSKRKNGGPSSSTDDISSSNGERSKRKRRRPARLDDGVFTDKRLIEKGVIPGGGLSLKGNVPKSSPGARVAADFQAKKTTAFDQFPSRERTPASSADPSKRERSPTKSDIEKSSQLEQHKDGSMPNCSVSLPAILVTENHFQREKLVDDIALTALLSRRLNSLDAATEEVAATDDERDYSAERRKASKHIKFHQQHIRNKQRQVDGKVINFFSDDEGKDDMKSKAEKEIEREAENELKNESENEIGDETSNEADNKADTEADIEEDSADDEGFNLSSSSIRQILRRLSKVERDCHYLKLKAAREEEAKIGEDATAAGLKHAVLAIASAAESFAKKRRYKVDVLSRAVDLLWGDQDEEVPADISLLRSVTKSLVFARAKRHANKKSSPIEPDLSDSPLAQNSDVRGQNHQRSAEESNQCEALELVGAYASDDIEEA